MTRSPYGLCPFVLIPQVSVHYTGLMVKYLEYSGPIKHVEKSDEEKEQARLERQYQKRKLAIRSIEDSLAFMLSYSEFKPLLFVLTTPAPGGWITSNSRIPSFNPVQKFFRNFSTAHDLKHYTWVREFGINGLPHYHVCADMAFRDVTKINNYWSRINNSSVSNSVRMHKGKDRFLHGRKAWMYFTKYMTKDLDIPSSGRNFAISSRLREKSKPQTFIQNQIPPSVYNAYDWSTPNEHSVSFGAPKNGHRQAALKELTHRF